MKKKSLLWLILLSRVGVAVGQTAAITGKVRTADNNTPCAYALIVLHQPDSTPLQYVFSSSDGSFRFKGVSYGSYILSVQHVSFQSLYRRVILNEHSPPDLGSFIMKPKPDSLMAALVTPLTVRPRLRGDTIEYDPAGIRLNKYADLESLLARLPGVKVDKDGNIMINGQRVEQVLVDGEEFFGPDLTLATRNLKADMLSLIQVLKKKSRRSAFTGIDDGQKTLVVNVVLKPEAKRGYFGKTSTGLGDQGYYDADAFAGSFTGRRQLAAVGMASNIGRMGLSYGEGLVSLRPGAGDALGTTAGQGVPKVVAGGLHYANTWGADQDHLVGNYQYGHISTTPVTMSTSVQTLPDTIYAQQQTSRSFNDGEQQGAFLVLDLPHGLSGWQFNFTGNDLKGNNRFYSSGSGAFNETPINASERAINSKVSDQNFQSSISWRIHARDHPGRIFSAVAAINGLNNQTKGLLYSLNRFYRPDGTIQLTDTTNQRKKITNRNCDLTVGVNYTDSIGNRIQLGLSYSFSAGNSRSDQDTYGRSENKYDQFIDSLSSQYQNRTTKHQLGLLLSEKLGKLRLNLGTDLEANAYRQMDQLHPTPFRYAYFSVAPRLFGDLAINSTSSLSFGYYGSSHQPAAQQLQPVQNNTDPLHIVMGNPDLHPVYTHNLRANFQQFKTLAISLGWQLAVNSSDIGTRTQTDSLGRQVIQPINIKGATSTNLFFSIGGVIKQLNIDTRFSTTLHYTRSYNFINTDLSGNDNYTASSGLVFSRFVPDKYNVQIGGGGGYTYSRSSLNPTAVIRYWTANRNFSGSYFPFPGLELNTTVDYTWRQKTSSFEANTSVRIWSAYLDKSFWSNKLNLRWTINNILNQNAGISRSSGYNQTTETITNTIGRYWMISAIYRFDKKPKK